MFFSFAAGGLSHLRPAGGITQEAESGAGPRGVVSVGLDEMSCDAFFDNEGDAAGIRADDRNPRGEGLESHESQGLCGGGEEEDIPHGEGGGELLAGEVCLLYTSDAADDLLTV